MTIAEYMDEKQEVFNRFLERYLPPEPGYQSIVHQAMRYSMFAGGKRLRPILALTAFEALGGRGEDIFKAGCALEMMHTFSLIHDDLPCMDDDDFRRGMPTAHKKFGEAMAVLSGDALCILAFQLLGEIGHPTLVPEVARALGTEGMLGGQVKDIISEGQPVTPEELEFIHIHKTEKLITTSLRVGALLAHASAPQLEVITAYGRCIGLGFQIVDDILDIEGTTEQLGKDAGSDQENQKATYPALYGLAESKTKARQLINQARQELKSLEGNSSWLDQLAEFIITRVN
jgi:geranylgeranyl diphosphate synthase type II